MFRLKTKDVSKKLRSFIGLLAFSKLFHPCCLSMLNKDS